MVDNNLQFWKFQELNFQKRGILEVGWQQLTVLEVSRAELPKIEDFGSLLMTEGPFCGAKIKT